MVATPIIREMVSTDVRCAFEKSKRIPNSTPDTIRRLEDWKGLERPTMAVDFISLLQNYEEAMTEVS
jgi:hypothetical protein